jgi:hypothetical protein
MSFSWVFCALLQSCSCNHGCLLKTLPCCYRGMCCGRSPERQVVIFQHGIGVDGLKSCASRLREFEHRKH